MRAFVLAACALLCALPARAWDRHDAITSLALRGIPALDAPVLPETLDAYLEASGRPSALAFLRERKLNPTTGFPYRAGEVAGSTIALRAVIAGYADEPDWAMDQQLFDFYPELWKDDYLYMVGKRDGFQSRVFRHSYWPAGFLKPPTPGSKLPMRDPAPLGEAPERAELFFELSREAFALGHPYWGGRFLAWSLHYVEDLGQPFHAVQAPSMDFLRYKPDGAFDLEATVRTVAYYHLAVDGFPVHAGEGKAGQAIRSRVEGALGGVDAADAPSARALALETAERSSREALRLADAASDLFPEPDPGALADPLGAVYSDAFWARVRGAGARDSAAFLRELDVLLGAQGRAIRGLALAAVPPAPGKSEREILDRKILERVQVLVGSPF